jgi:Protein of unknown function (DUF2855)
VVLGFFSSTTRMGTDPRLGFGKVVGSEVDNVETGEELFGYFPMSTHVVLRPGRIRSDGLYDVSEHRAHLSPAYNYYVRTFGNPSFDAESKREIMLLRPLFFASFLVHDLLAERVGAGADTIAITSASSKTAIGLAHLLSTRKIGTCHVVGLTSERNLDFARGIGVYDRVVTYGDREILTSGSVAVADFSGNSALIRQLRDALGNRAVFLCLVGYTHRDRQSLDIVEDAKMVRFFAPDQFASERVNGELTNLIGVIMRHYRRISVIHAAGLKLLRVSDQKKLARCLNVYLETWSALTKGIFSLSA